MWLISWKCYSCWHHPSTITHTGTERQSHDLPCWTAAAVFHSHNLYRTAQNCSGQRSQTCPKRWNMRKKSNLKISEIKKKKSNTTKLQLIYSPVDIQHTYEGFGLSPLGAQSRVEPLDGPCEQLAVDVFSQCISGSYSLLTRHGFDQHLSPYSQPAMAQPVGHLRTLHS